MSEIDVSKCTFYNDGKCNNPNGMACNCCNNAYCYYKQLQQLKQENEELKNKLDIMTNYFEKADGESFKYKQCLDEIKKECNNWIQDYTGYDRSNGLAEQLLQLIMQAKEVR